MKIPTKYIVVYVIIMLLGFVSYYFYSEKKSEEVHKKAIDFYKANIDMNVSEYITGWTFSLNGINYKYSDSMLKNELDFFYDPSTNQTFPRTRSVKGDKYASVVWNEMEEPYTIHKRSKSDTLIIIQDQHKFVFKLDKY